MNGVLVSNIMVNSDFPGNFKFLIDFFGSGYNEG